MASQTCTVPLAIWQAGHDVPLAIWRVGRDHPARHMANRTWIVPLAIWRAGHGSSRLPYGKPDEDVVLSIFRRFLLCPCHHCLPSTLGDLSTGPVTRGLTSRRQSTYRRYCRSSFSHCLCRFSLPLIAKPFTTKPLANKPPLSVELKPSDLNPTPS
ncbi:hypothetical protein YC2023_098625 [Brassica napus]